jgi:hypothetical protein
VDEAQKYDELSYTLDDETPSVSMLCNSQSILVTPTLCRALEMLQARSWPRPIWADAICIDQSNEQEKVIQVPMMGEIYSNANTVVVWLGAAGIYNDLAMDSIITLNEALGRYEGTIRFPERKNQIPHKSEPAWEGLRENFPATVVGTTLDATGSRVGKHRVDLLRLEVY